MQKDASYHQAAVMYNEELAEFAEGLSTRVGHEEVARWCRAVAKQHRFHAMQHNRALDKIKAYEQKKQEAPEAVEEPVSEPVES